MPVCHLCCMQFFRQVLSSGLPYSPRRHLFQSSLDATPALRRIIICRIAACTQWRGRLECKLLPRFLASFDSDCIRFFFRCVILSAQHLPSLVSRPHACIAMYDCKSFASPQSTVTRACMLAVLHLPCFALDYDWDSDGSALTVTWLHL